MMAHKLFLVYLSTHTYHIVYTPIHYYIFILCNTVGPREGGVLGAGGRVAQYGSSIEKLSAICGAAHTPSDRSGKSVPAACGNTLARNPNGPHGRLRVVVAFFNRVRGDTSSGVLRRPVQLRGQI